jgi:hypothetical protein
MRRRSRQPVGDVGCGVGWAGVGVHQLSALSLSLCVVVVAFGVCCLHDLYTETVCVCVWLVVYPYPSGVCTPPPIYLSSLFFPLSQYGMMSLIMEHTHSEPWFPAAICAFGVCE